MGCSDDCVNVVYLLTDLTWSGVSHVKPCNRTDSTANRLVTWGKKNSSVSLCSIFNLKLINRSNLLKYANSDMFTLLTKS